MVGQMISTSHGRIFNAPNGHLVSDMMWVVSKVLVVKQKRVQGVAEKYQSASAGCGDSTVAIADNSTIVEKES